MISQVFVQHEDNKFPLHCTCNSPATHWFLIISSLKKASLRKTWKPEGTRIVTVLDSAHVTSPATHGGVFHHLHQRKHHPRAKLARQKGGQILTHFYVRRMLTYLINLVYKTGSISISIFVCIYYKHVVRTRAFVESITKTWSGPRGGMPAGNKGKHIKLFDKFMKKKGKQEEGIFMCLITLVIHICTQKNSSFKVPPPLT